VHGPFADVAREVVGLGGCSGVVQVIGPSDVEDGMVEAREGAGKREGEPFVDLVFIDHDKECYLTDLKHVVGKKYLKRGCKIVADNVVVAGINDYLDYVDKGEEFEGHRVEEGWIEYKGDMEGGEDGVSICTYIGV
jgi:catechol O-methyltransferase